jgi:hypothetical protein
MPFGLSYAGYVVAVGAAMLYGPADTGPAFRAHDLTFGTTVQPWVTTGEEKVITYTYRSAGQVWGKFTPIYAIGVSDRHMVFAAAGLGRPLDVFGVKVMPYAGPALYTDPDQNNWIQFRTGFDIRQTLGKSAALTAGFYHISNGQANAASADVDVAHFGISMKF